MEELLQALSDAVGIIQEADSLLEYFAACFSSVVLILDAIIAIFGLGFIILTAVISVLTAVILYFAQAIPLSVLAKKAGCRQGWLAWIPVFQNIFALIVLSRISGKEEFQFAYGKIKAKHNSIVILGYVLFTYCGNAIVTVLIGLLNTIPILGQLAGLAASLLYLLPGAYCGVVEYVYLRDTLNVFKPDQEKNRIHAFIVVVLDALLTGRLARICYLFSMMKLQPCKKSQV